MSELKRVWIIEAFNPLFIEGIALTFVKVRAPNINFSFCDNLCNITYRPTVL